MATLGKLRELFACRLCWRIAFAVFAFILAIESLILVPSAKRFEANLLTQIANHAIIAVEPTLAASGYGGDPRALAEGIENSIGKYGILGVVVAGPGGETLAAAGAVAGLAGRLAHAAPMAEGGKRSDDNRELDIAWPSGAGLTVAVRADTNRVADEVLAYVLRIAGLVALIVLVVTAGTMLVLHRWVLRSVLRLRESALGAGADPDKAERFAVPTRRRDEMGELIGAHNALLARVAESKRRDREIAEERARYLSRHQVLTGLPNREALIEYVDGLAAQPSAERRCVSLLLLNLVQFRLLNARFGARRCDELLRQIAARLRRVAAPADFLAHLGADRFAIMRTSSQCGAGDAAAFAEILLREAGASYEVGGGVVASLALRIGIARSEDRVPEGRTLLTEAEFALARAADGEGARYQFYSPELAEQARNRQDLARDLEHAIERGELFPVLQPKMALDAGGSHRLAGAEALVRWRHPERGMVRPDLFIPLAESTGLIIPVGDFMLGAACRAIRDWRERFGWSPRVAVNLSANQFADPALAQRLERVLGENAVPAGLLEVEITETAAMKDVARTAATLGKLRALGVAVSIDDFGTGYSSLNYLRRFAVDAIKIDKSFVDDIGADRHAEVICDAILRLGRSLGTRVVAEGVENERQLAFLRQRRCDEVQGYLLGKPVPLDEFERSWIAARAAA